MRLRKRPQSQCHRADSAGEVAAKARLSIRFGRCEQFAASLRRVAIVLPGEIEKQNSAGVGGEERKRQNMTGEVQRHSSEVKRENPPRLYRRRIALGMSQQVVRVFKKQPVA